MTMFLLSVYDMQTRPKVEPRCDSKPTPHPGREDHKGRALMNDLKSDWPWGLWGPFLLTHAPIPQSTVPVTPEFDARI